MQYNHRTFKRHRSEHKSVASQSNKYSVAAGEHTTRLEKAIIIPIHKKGDRKECGNSRGISLLSVPGKVLTRVILNRIGKIIDERLRENQCGFRPGRGCSDQILTLRQLTEKNREFGRDIYISFIDFSQAYDSVWREGMWDY